MSSTTTQAPAFPKILSQSADAINWRGAHWFVRVPLAIILFDQGWVKMLDLTGQAEANGIPLFLFFLAALAEVGGAAGLIVGGAALSLNLTGWKTQAGDLLTRVSGFAIAAIVAGVIYMFYFDSFYSMRDHLMLLAGGLLFMLRGNKV
ncbi:MAG: hypothetical protein AAGH41_07875 [Pseudomonadota bacterium]